MNSGLIRSFGYALAGVKTCIRERNFRIQIIIAVFTFLSGIYFKISAYEWMAILISSSIVLSLEMINTSIEILSNHVCASFNPAIKHVKDIAAGAVCMASVIGFATGCIIFIPKIKSVINFLK